jgi:hypothetical protein
MHRTAARRLPGAWSGPLGRSPARDTGHYSDESGPGLEPSILDLGLGVSSTLAPDDSHYDPSSFVSPVTTIKTAQRNAPSRRFGMAQGVHGVPDEGLSPICPARDAERGAYDPLISPGMMPVRHPVKERRFCPLAPLPLPATTRFRGIPDDNVLGVGAYGKVRLENGVAAKKFDHRAYLIQEYAALRALRHTPGVVHSLGCCLLDMKVRLQPYQTSLRQCLSSDQPPLTADERYMILGGILLGLQGVHDRGLVHGDIKPSNILVNRTPVLRVAIGDLGFTGPPDFARCYKTADMYREPRVIADEGHDLYSLALVILELFGSQGGSPPSLPNFPTTEGIRRLANEYLAAHPQLRQIVHQCVGERHLRPRCTEIHRQIYGRDLPPGAPRPHRADFDHHVLAQLSTADPGEITHKKYRGARALDQYARKWGVAISELHIYATLYVLGAIYGPSNGYQSTRYPLESCMDLVLVLLNCDEFIDQIL